MAKILIRNLNNRSVHTKDNSKSILNIIHDDQIDWMHACGAKGRCTSCKMIVHEGLGGFDSPNSAEQRMIDLGRLAKNERLACQNKLNDDIEISVAEINKFPHVNYSD